ncbi:cyclic AMP-responsive element-binding protein 3-like protein 3-A isoform X2 [Fundulus heteroclitus]|uniref:cyclic AMP-responsive element-binding protein 3-like protein 3-A isoform X2 n=1 Tax=Fundulus heteroclitus TaxID=8078 RepID=UPI00165B68D1|nr:cyclic AMP-responsive element-binding protein 3-like protein 3-A isoform X2 [Fundulus heteroclitus]
MTLTADMEHGGLGTFNLLGSTEESAGCYSNHPWTPNDTPSPQSSGADDFLDALLHDPSSVPASPLWSPCITDKGVNEDPLAELAESPHPISCTAFSAFDIQVFPQPPDLENPTAAAEKLPDVSIDLGWESEGCHKEFGITYYLSNSQAPLLQPSCALTVKDLLLSNLGQNFEERILKKIRRKIRNKRSAQESRKKKREYVDSLEGRMAACSAQNLELQRKIQTLEETNNALLEQLSRLQALLPNSCCKTTNRGTCILVLLLSFSLLISSNIQPNPYSQRSYAEYTETTVSSRSLQSTDEAGNARPLPPPLPSSSWGFEDLRGLKERLWAQTDLPTVRLGSPHRQEHRNRDDYGSWRSRNM